jgi:hypothetical protein
VCAFSAQVHSGPGTRPPPPHAAHWSLLFMAAPGPVASHLVAFTGQAPITARSGSSQGLGPKDFQDALAVRKLAGREGVRVWTGVRPRILEPLTAPVEG